MPVAFRLYSIPSGLRKFLLSDVTTLLRDVAAESATKDTRAAMFWAYHSGVCADFEHPQ